MHQTYAHSCVAMVAETLLALEGIDVTLQSDDIERWPNFPTLTQKNFGRYEFCCPFDQYPRDQENFLFQQLFSTMQSLVHGKKVFAVAIESEGNAYHSWIVTAYSNGEYKLLSRAYRNSRVLTRTLSHAQIFQEGGLHIVFVTKAPVS